MYVHVKPNTKQRVLSFFMAFAIIFVSLPYVGLNITVNATYSAIHSGATAGCMSGVSASDNKYTYTGNIKTGDVEVYDYLTDKETLAEDIDLGVGSGGYHDPYLAFNKAISESDTSGSPLHSSSTTVTINYISDGNTIPANEYVYAHFWRASTSLSTTWPGVLMNYDSVNEMYTCTFVPEDFGFNSSDDLYMPNRLIINGGDNSSNKTFDIERQMAVGNTYTYNEQRKLVGFKVGTSDSITALKVKMWDDNDNVTEESMTLAYGTTKYFFYDITNLGYTPTKIKFKDINNNSGWFTNELNFGGAVQPGHTAQFNYSSKNTIDGPYDITTKTNGNFKQSALSSTSGSQPIYDTKYTNPLYFGMFYIDNNASSYTEAAISSTATAKNYNNFHWLTNMGLKSIEGQDHNYRGSSSVQGLVEDKLTADGALTTAVSSGKLRQGTNELPYFSKDWAGDHSTIMKYYDKDGENNIAFPFYEVTTPIYGDGANANVSLKEGDTAKNGDCAKYYQFSSKDSNLYFSGDSGTHTGYFTETNVPIESTFNKVGFFPFDENNHETTSGGTTTKHPEKNNVGFGMKWQMTFTLQPDGCVGVTDSEGEYRDSTLYPERVHTTFEFKGDDDLWVFIDDNLILDMGGDHTESHGVIDFATGIAKVDKAVTYAEGIKNSLSAAITVPKNSENFKSNISGYDSGTQQYDGRPHVITVFYMERGMADSNLLIRYNYTPMNNTSKMKIQEITNFDSVNPGLRDLTMQAAENDVFKYTVYNTGTDADDVKDPSKKYPENEDRTRTSAYGNITTFLTQQTASNDADYNYVPPAVTNPLTEGNVKNTSYTWVDDFADMNHSTQGTGVTYSTDGYFFLMYGTSDMESSAEFNKQFSRYSLMRVRQIGNDGDVTTTNDEQYLYKPNRGDGTNAATFEVNSSRKVDDYYITDAPYIFSNLNTNAKNYLDNRNSKFSFRNDVDPSNLTLGSETRDANEVVAVQMTEVFKNNVRTGNLEVTKTVTNEASNTDLFQLKLTLSNIFGVSGVNPAADGYGNITVDGAYNARGNKITKLAADGTFYIKPGAANKVIISDIPYDTDYTITETNGSFFNQTSASISGDIKGESAIVKSEGVVNVRMTGDLVLEKLLGGYPADSSMNDGHDFTFNVTLNIPDGVSNYTIQKGGENLTFTSGEPFEVTVPAGSANKVTISGIPRGTTYSVTETDLQGATSKTESNTSGTIVGSTVTATITNNYPNIIEVTAEKKNSDQTIGLSGAELELWYKDSYLPSATKFNDPFITPTKQVTVTIPSEPTAPSVKSVTYSTENKKMNYSYEYSSESTPSVTSTSWILPRSDNDYIYFRDYNSGDPADYDQQSFKSGQDTSGKQNGKRSWLYTDFSTNQETQNHELNYTHNYWYEAQFSGTGKKDVKYSIWERFVDRYDSNGKAQDTVVWKIQPPDGYDKVRFCLYDGSQCIRTTEQITFKLGEIYHKTKWGRYYRNENGKNCYFEVPLTKEGDWATYRASGESDVDKRMSGSNMKQAERYTPTEQKVIFHCNSNTVWHNIHIEFFKNTGTDASPVYEPVGQQFPGYMMEPYAYAGDNYRVGNYLTYELTIPDGATHFRVNNGVAIDGTSPYRYYSNYTKLHNATDKNGYKNYANYFSINGDSSGHNVTSGTAVALNDWTGYPSADERSKTYTSNAVESDYDYIYFEAPNSWGTHIYAYFYGGGNLRDDNWQRACYSVWPGITPVGTEFTAEVDSGSDGHSDIYDYPLTGSIANPDNTFVDNNSGTTVYKFKVPLGERRNYSKVIFNNGLKTQVSSEGSADGKTHETGVITYHRGYLYKADGSSYQHYENKPTNQFEQRGDKLYIRTSDHATGKTWDDLHVRFYNASGTQILQSGSGYVMQYSGVNNVSGTDYTYYSIPIPKDAVKFSLSNGKSSYSSNTGTKNDLTTEKYDIPSYNPSLDISNVTTADVTKGDVVYKLTDTSLEQVSPSITMTETEDTTVTSGSYTPENPSPRGDHIYIKDTANVLSAIPTIAFYEFEDSASPISMSPALTAVELEENPAGTQWYSIGIPTNATYFTINGGSDKYVIYPKSSGSNQMYATPGDMYYDTVTSTTLAIAWPTFTSDADDFTDEHYTSTSPYGQRGDYLYVVNGTSLTNPKVIFYNSSGVPITNAAGSSEISLKSIGQITAASGTPVDGKTSNDTNAQGYWYRAAIPTNAAYFVVKDGSTTTERSEIFEKKDKINRYSKDYTLGDMQYRIDGTDTQLLYPIFTEDPDYTLDAGGGKTISSNGSTVRVDQTKVSDYAGYNAATAATYSSVPDPQQALYQTDTNTATVSWAGEGSGGASDNNYEYVRFAAHSSWTNVKAYFYDPESTISSGSYKPWADSLSMTNTEEVYSNGSYLNRNVWKVRIPKSGDNYLYKKVIFYGTSNTTATQTIDYTLSSNDGDTYGRGEFLYDAGGAENNTKRNVLRDSSKKDSAPTMVTTTDNKLRFDDLYTAWGGVKVKFYDSSKNELNSTLYTMDHEGDSIYSMEIPSDIKTSISYVKFYKSSDTSKKTNIIAISNYGENKICQPTFTISNRTRLYWIPDQNHRNDQMAYYYKSDNTQISWHSDRTPSGRIDGTGTSGPNSDANWYYTDSIPSNATQVRFKSSDNNVDYVQTGKISISDIPMGYGVRALTYSSHNFTYEYYPLAGYDFDDTGISWTETVYKQPLTTVTYTAVYQPEDRYGMISTANSGTSPVTDGTADINNFIYIKTAISDPYIMFYKDANATAGQEIGGSNMAATGIKLSEVCGNTGSPYKIRLPKDAMSFRLSDGATALSSNKVLLQQTINADRAKSRKVRKKMV